MRFSYCQWTSALGLALAVHAVLILTVDATTMPTRTPDDKPEFVMSFGGGLVPPLEAKQIKTADELRQPDLPMNVVDRVVHPVEVPASDKTAPQALETPAAAAPSAAPVMAPGVEAAGPVEPPAPDTPPTQPSTAIKSTTPEDTQPLAELSSGTATTQADIPSLAPSLPLAATGPEGNAPSGQDVVIPAVPPTSTADASVSEAIRSIALAPVTPPAGALPSAPLESARAGSQAPVISESPPQADTGAVVTETTPVPAPVPLSQPESVVVARAVPMHSARDVAKATAEYAALLKSWLQGHMHYPHEARLKGQQGTVVVTVVMTRDGRIESKELERSSGFRVLDQEALEMVRRAAPLPPLPPEMTELKLAIRIPVRFNIKDYEEQRTLPPIHLR